MENVDLQFDTERWLQFKIINLIDNQAEQMHIVCQRDLFITLYLIKLVQTRLVRWLDSWKSDDATAKVAYTNIYQNQLVRFGIVQTLNIESQV